MAERCISAYLTPRGRAVRPIAVAAGNRVEARWAALTSPEQIETLQRSLQNLLQQLEDDTPQAT